MVTAHGQNTVLSEKVAAVIHAAGAVDNVADRNNTVRLFVSREPSQRLCEMVVLAKAIMFVWNEREERQEGSELLVELVDHISRLSKTVG